MYSQHVTALQSLRRFLLVILVVGLSGTFVELLLLKHDEDATQLVPLAVLALSLVTILWHAARPSGASATAVKVVMVLSIAAGLAGIYFHYSANREFALEGEPALAGRALWSRILEAKVPPALAPGVLVQLGLLGLAYTYRHKEQ